MITSVMRSFFQCFLFDRTVEKYLEIFINHSIENKWGNTWKILMQHAFFAFQYRKVEFFGCLRGGKKVS